MEYTFIKYDSMLTEFKYVISNIKYDVLFNNMDKDVRNDLAFLTEYYYEYFTNEMTDDTFSLSLKIPSVKCVDTLPVTVSLYIDKAFLNLSDEKIKIGFTVFINKKDSINNTVEILQNMYISNCDLADKNSFKNYIYNILFYMYIVLHEFEFHPLLKYVYHSDDIPDMIMMNNAHIRLFAEIKECAVCLDPSITKTICNHTLCKKCFCSMVEKKCPLCRKKLNEDVTQSDFFIRTQLL